MAGYQRHDFETTSVSPGSDGEWGAFARGFSNGHSMGRAISTAVNRRNISKANEDYQKDVEAANQQDIKTQEEMDPELKKAGVSDRAAIMTKSQLENLSPEAQEYFKDYYRSQQLQGNKPEYRYDFATRQGMLDDAASRRKEAIQSSFLKHMGPEAYNEYRRNEATANTADYEDVRTQKKMAMRNFLEAANSGTPDGYRAILSMGQKLGINLPEGVQVDLEKGTLTQMGPNGKPVVQPLSMQAVQPYLDQVRLKMYDDIYMDDPKARSAELDYRYNRGTIDARMESTNQKPILERRADDRAERGLRHTIDMDNKNYGLNVAKFHRGMFESDRSFGFKQDEADRDQYNKDRDYGFRWSETNRDQYNKDRDYTFRQDNTNWEHGFRENEAGRDQYNRDRAHNFDVYQDAQDRAFRDENFNWQKNKDIEDREFRKSQADREQSNKDREYGIALNKDNRAAQKHEADMKNAVAEFATKYGVQPDQVEIKTIKGGEYGDKSIIVNKKTGEPVQNIDPTTGATFPLGFSSLQEYQGVIDQIRKYIGPNGQLQENWKEGIIYQGKRYKSARELQSALDVAVSRAKAGGKEYKNKSRAIAMRGAQDTMKNVFSQAIPTPY